MRLVVPVNCGAADLLSDTRLKAQFLKQRELLSVLGVWGPAASPTASPSLCSIPPEDRTSLGSGGAWLCLQLGLGPTRVT